MGVTRKISLATIAIAAAGLSTFTAADVEIDEVSHAAHGWMEMRDSGKAEYAQHMDWSAKKMRMSMDGVPREGAQTVIVADLSTGESMMYVLGDAVPEEERVAILMQRDPKDADSSAAAMQARVDAAQQLGERQVHGETCTLLQFDEPMIEFGDEATGQTSCLTRDGIVVQALADDGKSTMLEITDLERGPQKASLFELPPGYRTMNMGGMSSLFGDKDIGDLFGNNDNKVDAKKENGEQKSGFGGFLEDMLGEAAEDTVEETKQAAREKRKQEIGEKVRGLFGLK